MTTNPKSFETPSPIKDQIRQLIPAFAQANNIDPEVIFTLSGKEMLDVPVFKHVFPRANIRIVERTKGDFEEIVKKSQGQHTVLKGTISEYANFPMMSPHHGIIFLDYFGPLVPEKMKEIRNFITNKNLVHDKKPTLLALTFQKDRYGSGKETIKLVSEVWEPEEVENSAEGAAAAVWLELCRHKKKVKLEYYTEYRNPGGCQMYFIIFIIGE
jgi:hypothetical protein